MSAGALAAARAALAGADAWIVGGTVRDALLGRPTADADLVVAGDVERAARALAAAERAAAFPLGEEFGAWRVVSRRGGWQLDLSPLTGGTIEEDLARRDFTINAMAAPLAAGTPDPAAGSSAAEHIGAVIDPFGGRADLEARILRMVAEPALVDDPLRTLRAARLAVELTLAIEPETARAVHAHAPGLARVAPERVWAELKRIVRAADPVRGVRELAALAVLPVVLPELAGLAGDVLEHRLAVLGEVLALERDPAPALGPHAAAVAARLATPFADELTRGEALRIGALLHPAPAPAPATPGERPDGRFGFPGYDSEGARLARAALERLRTSEKLRAHVAALAGHRLRPGLLVAERPLPRRTLWAYLRATEPVTLDVTVLSIANRLAAPGRDGGQALADHLDLARELLGEALARETGPPPLVRGDELAGALDLAPGPALGALLAELEAARFAGEVSTPEEAIAHARAILEAR